MLTYADKMNAASTPQEHWDDSVLFYCPFVPASRVSISEARTCAPAAFKCTESEGASADTPDAKTEEQSLVRRCLSTLEVKGQMERVYVIQGPHFRVHKHFLVPHPVGGVRAQAPLHILSEDAALLQLLESERAST